MAIGGLLSSLAGREGEFDLLDAAARGPQHGKAGHTFVIHGVPGAEVSVRLVVGGTNRAVRWSSSGKIWTAPSTRKCARVAGMVLKDNQFLKGFFNVASNRPLKLEDERYVSLYDGALADADPVQQVAQAVEWTLPVPERTVAAAIGARGRVPAHPPRRCASPCRHRLMGNP